MRVESTWSRVVITAIAALWPFTHAHAQAPYLVTDMIPGAASSDAAFVGALGDAGFFNARGFYNNTLYSGLWRTQGTAGSTTAEILYEGGTLATPGLFSLPNGFLFTISLDGGPKIGVAKLDVDGNFQSVANPEVGPTDFGKTATNGPLGLYAARSQNAGPVPFHLFQTNGIESGTFPLTPVPGYPLETALSSARQSTDRFREGFAAAMAGTAGVWISDGQGATTRVTPDGVLCQSVKSAAEQLFMSCFDTANPQDLGGLYVSDGSAAGTRRLLSIEQGNELVLPWLELDGLLYFTHRRQNHPELWRSDGTAAGTVSLADLVPLPPDLMSFPLTVSSGVLYFIGHTASTGSEMWRTDGTVAGTYLLRDIAPGPGWGVPLLDAFGFAGRYTTTPGGLLFAASASGGEELWITDGTTVGTVPLPDIAPGPASSFPSTMVFASPRVFFTATDGIHGREPWAVDLPTRGVAVDDVTVHEGDSGTVAATFPVRLDAPSTSSVVVSYGTIGGSAQSGADFLPAAGVLTFDPGEVEHTVDVTVLGDMTNERAESFALKIDAVSGAQVADGTGFGVIVDDDLPRITVGVGSGVEGHTGESPVIFTVTLTTHDGAPSSAPVTIRAAVVPSVATAADFPPLPLTPAPAVTFPAGTPSGASSPLTVLVRGDTEEEPNELFHLQLDGGNDASVPATDEILGVILDDDGVQAAPPVELAHGSRVLADLAPPAGRASDVDFYVLQQHSDASYEITADGVSGDAVPLAIERVADYGTVLQTAEPTGTGPGLSMRWYGYDSTSQRIRVSSAACGSTCGTDDVYRLRMYETTLAAARMNTTGSQRSVLILHNAGNQTASAVVLGWSEGGDAFLGWPVTIEPRATSVLDLGFYGSGYSGSLTIPNDAPYGTLVGKVATFDPATGFAFDTPLTYRRR